MNNPAFHAGSPAAVAEPRRPAPHSGWRALLRRIRRRVKTSALPLRYFVRSQWCRLSGLDNGLPVPPRELTFLVGGGYDVARSLSNGILTAQAIRSTLLRHDLRIEGFESLLDFGCGSGRILRNWRSLPGQVCGSDCNVMLVDWCRRNLPFARFAVNGLEPPTSWPDEAFDFVYAISVFTHLSEIGQRAWIRELSRLLRPKGRLLITTHGEAYLRSLAAVDQGRFQRGDLVVFGEDRPGSNACVVYHPTSWVEHAFADQFRLLERQPEGARGTGRQDIYLFEKGQS